MGYLKPNPIYTQSLYIYDNAIILMVWKKSQMIQFANKIIARTDIRES